MAWPGGFEAMKDVLTALTLLSAPALVLVVYGARGPEGGGLGEADPAAIVDEESRTAFAEDCARCHGPLGRGTARGPSLVTGEIAALGDARLRRAIRLHPAAGPAGRAEAPFGALPEGRLDQIITFLREMQRLEAAR